MAKLTYSQIEKIKRIIKEHMSVIMYITTGAGKPSPEMLRKMKLPKSMTDLITSSYQYGKLGVIRNKDLSTLPPSEVRRLLRDLQLTKEQQRSVEYSKLKAQQYIDNLTQKTITNTVSAAIQSDLAMWDAVKEVIPAAIENNSPRAKVVQELRDKTGDMFRDWHRVAQTEMWGAKCHGEAEAIMNGESPLTSKKGEADVYIRPAWDACPKCFQMYLENDKVTPRVFKLAELMANGTNYGKKQADWVPVVPPLHPNCQCVMNVKPQDTSFDSQGNLVYRGSSQS